MRRPYGFRAYYGPNAKAPKVEGELAIEVFWTDAQSRDMEAAIAAKRPDIGRVEKLYSPR